MRKLHRVLAGAWLLLAVPAVIFWKDSVLFVIIASLYANVMSSLAASEAANDTALIKRLDRIESMLTLNHDGDVLEVQDGETGD